MRKVKAVSHVEVISLYASSPENMASLLCGVYELAYRLICFINVLKNYATCFHKSKRCLGLLIFFL